MQGLKTTTNKFIIAIVLAIMAIALVQLLTSSAPEKKDGIKVNKEEIARLEKEAANYKSKQEQLKLAIKAYFETAIARKELVGVGVSIVKGDSVVLSEGFGRKNINLKEQVNGETVFRLGSLSKGFGGILAAHLEAKGKLAWEDKVVDYLPQFRFGDSLNTQKITLAHILSHSSGAPYHSFTNLVEAGLPLKTIAGRFKEVAPISAPGELYSYQNAMFAISQEIMSASAGQEITKTFQSEIINPLEMCSTSLDHKSLLDAGNVAIPHTRSRRGWKSQKLTNSYYNALFAGGINASSTDMAKWMRFLLGHNPEVMSKAAITKVFKPFVEIKGGYKYYYRWPGHISSHYGFGWRIHKFKASGNTEKTIWHHGGSVNNYRNEIALFPEADLGICVLFNGNSRLAQTVIPDIYSIVRKTFNISP
ncbi:MAG: serine hydrolase domain-containing protein [Flavobacteriaceae bacterium]